MPRNKANAESAPQASNPESSDARPEAASSDVPQPAVAASTAAPLATSPAPSAAQPTALPAAPVKAPELAPAAAVSADKSSAPQKPAPAAGPSPARMLELKLREELNGQQLNGKLNIQATANALTLSGSMTIAEHRDLMGHLRTVPAGVRVVDDIDLTGDVKATPAPAAAPALAAASAGWIWVRSTPPAARIVVDGAETGLRTPARLELQTGDHEVQLIRRGFVTSHRNVTVESGQTIQFTETLPEQQGPSNN
jgi:hypothetical protein